MSRPGIHISLVQPFVMSTTHFSSPARQRVFSGPWNSGHSRVPGKGAREGGHHRHPEKEPSPRWASFFGTPLRSVPGGGQGPAGGRAPGRTQPGNVSSAISISVASKEGRGGLWEMNWVFSELIRKPNRVGDGEAVSGAVISSARFVPCLRDIAGKLGGGAGAEQSGRPGADLLICKPLNSLLLLLLFFGSMSSFLFEGKLVERYPSLHYSPLKLCSF